MKINPEDYLIVVDVQYDFMSGALAVPGGWKVLNPICSLAHKFKNVILTQDWHPDGHSSFVDQGGPWPIHCLQESEGAKIARDIYDFFPHAQLILRKGFKKDVDSYSAFYDASGESTGLFHYLKKGSNPTIYVVGLATDYCVKATAVDASARCALKTVVIQNCCMGVNEETTKEAFEEMARVGVKLINTWDIE